MKRIRVESAAIRSIGYDKENKTMQIEFEDGGVYDYYNVPEKIYHIFLKAESHGTFFHENIKDVFIFVRVS